MHIKLTNQIRKVLFRSMLGLISLFAGFVVAGLPVALAQEVVDHQVGKHFSVTTMEYPDGDLLDKLVISGPPTPPPGFDMQRQAVSLPRPDKAGAFILTVPAFNWVFGCSSVSGAMIAGYNDRNGWPDIYAGPTNGGVMPLDNSSWGTWSDGFSTYPNLPLAASHNGVDGRASNGSIDDYWVQYGSTANDPYVTGAWTQHAWGDAIGDYMKTSQSAYGNTDGSTTFYNWTSSATPLTCADMATYGIQDQDGTYGRKLFYEARGYTVTDCYSQKTDNTITGGFSFAQLKSEIDAGRPVMLNLAGHTVVAVGYDDAGTAVYIHDTWDYLNHTMTWGDSYAGMQLLSVSIVNLQTLPPSITSATSTTADGRYKAGRSINVTINFDKAVSTDGLTIALNSGSAINTGALSMVSAYSGTYEVNAGENSPDLTVTSVTGTITAALGASTDDPTIPAGQNIADSKAIVIDTTVPVLGSLIPTPITTEQGTSRTFTTVYSDPDGQGNLRTAELLVTADGTKNNAVYLTYNNVNKTIRLYDDVTGTTVVATCAPGEAAIIENSLAVLDCAKTTVTRSGDNLTLKWNITPKTGFAGATKQLKLRAVDKAGNIAAFAVKGYWTIIGTNNKPAIETLTPAAATSKTGVEKTFTAAYSDLDGNANLKAVDILITAAVTGQANGILARYDRTLNKFFLYNDAGATSGDSCSPGEAKSLANSQGSLNCTLTTRRFSGTDLTVSWKITPLFSGSKLVKMRATDNSSASTGWVKKGDWTITAP